MEDLARGTDITTLDDQTIRIAPRPTEDKKAKRVATELAFAKGRLTERRHVEMPSGKTLSRETYSAGGKVQWFNAEGKVVSESNLAVEPAEEAPDLAPDTKTYLVLTLPYRTQQQVWQAFGIQNWNFNNIKEEAAQALIGTFYLQYNPWQAYSIYSQHYQSKGRKLIGMAVLFAASSNHYNFHGAGNLGNLLNGHGQLPVAKYLAVVSDPQRRGNTMVGNTGAEKGSFLQELAAFRDLYVHWQSNKPIQGNDAAKKAERERALQFVRDHQASPYGWAILSLVRERGGLDRGLAEAFRQFENCPGLEYAARYEYARCCLDNGDAVKARKLFQELYQKTLADGTLPAIDASFRQAFLNGGKDAKSYGELIRQTAATLLAQKRRGTVIRLAGQCRQLQDTLLADDLLALALKDVPAEERLTTTLAAVEHLMQTNQLKRADELMQTLLKDPKLNENPTLWSLAASLASRQRVTIRSVEYLDRRWSWNSGSSRRSSTCSRSAAIMASC